MENSTVAEKQKNGYDTDNLYHNVSLLLKNYRKFDRLLQSKVSQAEVYCEKEFGKSVHDITETTDLFEFDASYSYTRNLLKNASKIQNALQQLKKALSSLRKYHTNGEEFFYILNYSYIAKTKSGNEPSVDVILRELDKVGFSMNKRNYYKKRARAAEALKKYMWMDIGIIISNELKKEGEQ